ncbi:MAG: glycosyltransferase [Edaphocola sp.]
MSTPKISVIVPAYNAAAYLEKCVDSLLSQTLPDIEIILVDDASTDHTLALMQGYARLHPDKIKVIHSDVNLRQGGARNLGLQAATGLFIGFVDSDDWVEPEMYAALYHAAHNEDSDIAYCLRKQVHTDGCEEGDSATYFLPTGNVTEDSRREMLVRHVTFIQRYIYKRSLFAEHQISFPTHLWYEDMMIDPLVLMYVRKISAVKKPFYNYFIRLGSTITSKNNTKYRDRVKVSQIIVDELKKRGFYEQYKAEINYLYYRKGYILASLNYIINDARPTKKALEEIRAQLLAIDGDYRQNRYYGSNKFFMLIDRWLQLPGGLPISVLKFLLRFKRLSI